MINLKEIIDSFSIEKQQEFILYLEKKNKRTDTKNKQLVKLLIADNLSSKEICYKLYQKDNKPALHALRKRLFDSLIDFTANSNLKEKNSIDIKLIKFIIAARTFLQKGQFTIGYKILEKAEIIAKEQQLFTILNEIYHSKIQYSYANTSLKLATAIEDFKENQQQLLVEENLNIAYAKIRKSLIAYQHKKTSTDIKTLINSILKEQDIIVSNSLSFKSLYQIIQITSISAIQKFDYWNIETFVIDTYKLIKNHNARDKQLFYHLEILYVIANICFRNKKFSTSQEYLKLMFSCMNENNRKYYNQFLPKYNLLLALNFNYTNKQVDAIYLLETYIEDKKIDIVAQLDMYLSLIVFYFQQKSLEKAQKLFAKFYHTDKWYVEKAGIIWTIKKSLIEILLHIDLGNINLVESRLKSFKRNYFNHLKNIEQEKVIHYLKLVETYYKNPEIVTTKLFFNKVEESFNWIDKEKEDIFMISFYAWLKAKMTKQDVYLVTQKLINPL